jgi:hypothetical protein
MKKPYTFFDHRHKFAVWAAARATQRGWKGATTKIIKDALENCGVRQFTSKASSRNTRLKKFERLYREWCKKICSFLKKRHVQGVTYGRAAKIVAIYLKSMLILSGSEYSPLARVAHPPVDATLLENLPSEIKAKLPENVKRWTKLKENDYYDGLIKPPRAFLGRDEPSWKLEEYFDPVPKG